VSKQAKSSLVDWMVSGSGGQPGQKRPCVGNMLDSDETAPVALVKHLSCTKQLIFAIKVTNTPADFVLK